MADCMPCLIYLEANMDSKGELAQPRDAYRGRVCMDGCESLRWPGRGASTPQQPAPCCVRPSPRWSWGSISLCPDVEDGCVDWSGGRGSKLSCLTFFQSGQQWFQRGGFHQPLHPGPANLGFS